LGKFSKSALPTTTCTAAWMTTMGHTKTMCPQPFLHPRPRRHLSRPPPTPPCRI
jgi:hypothetical protein